MFGNAANSQLTAQVTVTASLTAFLYEGFTYNAVFLGRVLPAVGKEDLVTPYLIAFNLVWGLALWSYLKVSWADPGAVPDQWHEFVRKVGISLPIAPGMREWQPGKATMCKQCSRPRPERAHHCGICGVCIMRLDHHCPWINNCVGFGNHKYFLQCIIYALISCIVGVGTAAPELYETTKRLKLIVHGVQGNTALEPTDEIAFLVFGILGIFISLFVCPLLYIQLRLAVLNRTTIEDNYDNMDNPFDQGYIGNIAQIFGHGGPDWLLPIQPWRPFLDGVSFPSSQERFHGDARPLNGGWSSPYNGYDSSNFSEDWGSGRNLITPKNGRRTLDSGYADSGAGEEERWRTHYSIFEPNQEPLELPRNLSTLDYMMGCMQIDCDGNPRANP